MSNLSDQLIDLRMDDAVPTENLVVEEGDEDGDNGPNAPSPSESDAASKERRGSRSELKLQKHQVCDCTCVHVSACASSADERGVICYSQVEVATYWERTTVS